MALDHDRRLARLRDRNRGTRGRLLAADKQQSCHHSRKARRAGVSIAARLALGMEEDRAWGVASDGVVWDPLGAAEAAARLLRNASSVAAIGSRGAFGREQPANSARFTFLDPSAVDFYTDWDRVANDLVAHLRSEAGRNPSDRGLSDLVGELSTRSEDFRVRWAGTCTSTAPATSVCIIRSSAT